MAASPPPSNGSDRSDRGRSVPGIGLRCAKALSSGMRPSPGRPPDPELAGYLEAVAAKGTNNIINTQQNIAYWLTEGCETWYVVIFSFLKSDSEAELHQTRGRIDD